MEEQRPDPQALSDHGDRNNEKQNKTDKEIEVDADRGKLSAPPDLHFHVNQVGLEELKTLKLEDTVAQTARTHIH